MLAKNFLLISGFAALAFASPRGTGADSSDSTGASTSEDTTGAYAASEDPTGDSSDSNAAMASASSLMGLLKDLPTLPASVNSVLATAVPKSVLTGNLCELKTGSPDWMSSLPSNVQSDLSSYQTAIQSWTEAHSSELAALPSAPGIAACTGGSAPTGTGSSSSPKETGSGSSTGTGATESTPKDGAAAPSTAVVGSLAGALGMLAVMLAL